MVNGLHLYSTFIQSAVQFMPLIHPFTHTFTQLRVRCLAQGHFDMPRVGSNRHARQQLLPLEPYHPQYSLFHDCLALEWYYT